MSTQDTPVVTDIGAGFELEEDVAVNVVTQKQEIATQDGTTLYKQEIVSIHRVGNGEDVSEKMTFDQLDRIDELVNA